MHGYRTRVDRVEFAGYPILESDSGCNTTLRLPSAFYNGHGSSGNGSHVVASNPKHPAPLLRQECLRLGRCGALQAARRRTAAWRHARIAALRAEGQTRRLPVPIGSAIADRALRLQAATAADARDGSPGLCAAGAAADGDDCHAVIVPHRPVDFLFPPTRTVRRVGQRITAAHGRDRRQAVLREVHAHRGDQSRPGRDLLPDRRSARGTAVDRRLDFLRIGQREPRSAGIRRDGVFRHGKKRPAAVRQALGKRVPADSLPRRQVPLCRRPSAVPDRPGRCRPKRSASIPRRSRQAEHDQVRGFRRPGDPDSGSAVRNGVPDADLRTGADGSLQRARIHVQALRGRSTQARDLCGELLASPQAAGTRRSIRAVVSSRLGPTSQSSRSDSEAVRGYRSRLRRARQGS